MFKGFNNDFQNQLEKTNRDTDEFIFSSADLELVEINDKKRKCRIISEELRGEFQKLVSGSSKPTFIEFNFSPSYYYNDSIFFNSPGNPYL